ncbi:protein PELPK1 [Actinidia eriantha]|uniref:protein PELPK1 n=1 Tax=Actinidia eriantha TaxID=165200 RepID=UPI002587C4C4|nr:protein PELPK1 [Actinidia eriantha]
MAYTLLPSFVLPLLLITLASNMSGTTMVAEARRLLELTLPELPKPELPSIPTLPKVEIPHFPDFPEFEVPKFPELPNFPDLPELSKPTLPAIPALKPSTTSP